MNGIPKFDVDINSADTSYEGIKRLLKHIRPAWHSEDIRFEVFTEGYSNQLVGCTHKDDVGQKEDVVLARIYGEGSEQFIDRENEKFCMMLFHSVGSAAPLYCAFRNGIMYGYTPGSVINYTLAQDMHIQRLVTRQLARVHCMDVRGLSAMFGDGLHHKDNKPALFTTLYKWLDLIPQTFSDPDKQRRLDDRSISKAMLRQEIDCLHAVLPHIGSPVVFCHNDLLFKNIIYDKHKDKVTFIDFEYQDFNYQAFDIANHFCEFADMENIDFSRYPSKDYQLGWLRLFLESYFEFSGREDMVKDKDVETIYVQVNKFALGAHLFWALWALVQCNLSIIDYDYLNFAINKLEEYQRRKQEFMSLSLPS